MKTKKLFQVIKLGHKQFGIINVETKEVYKTAKGANWTVYTKEEAQKIVDQKNSL